MEKLNIFYWNCASGIVKKIDFIKQTIRDKGAHIFFIAEAEVPLGMDLGVFRIAGYDLVCAKTIQSREKARLICYVKQNMFQQMEDTLNPYNDIIMLTHKNLTIVGLYRGFKLHENENDRSNWLRLMSDLNSVITSNEVFIVGDLNVDVSKLNSRFHDELKFWSDSHGLNICSQGVTRRRKVMGSLQESTLDLLLTNCNRFEMEYKFNELSDHCIVCLKILGFPKVERFRRKITCVNWNFDLNAAKIFMNDYLTTSPDMSSTKVINLDYGIRASLILAFNRFVQTTDLVVRNEQEIISPKIRKLKNRKNRSRKVWSRYQTPENWERYLKTSRELRREVRRSRRLLLMKRANKGPKQFWSEVNKLMGKQQSSIDKIKIADEEVKDPKALSNLFADFFVNKVDKILGNYVPYTPDSLKNGVNDEFENFEL